MRQVILDPQETANPAAEQFVGLTTASKAEYKCLEDFITQSGDHFPFSKIRSPRHRSETTIEELLRFINPISETYPKEAIPLPEASGYKYADDGDYQDYAYETSGQFVRIVWATTA